MAESFAVVGEPAHSVSLIGSLSVSYSLVVAATLRPLMSVDNQSCDRDLVFVESVDHPQRRGVPG